MSRVLHCGCREIDLFTNSEDWSFAVFGGLRGQVGGVLAGFAGFRANSTENPEAPARATSDRARTLKLQSEDTRR